MSKLNPGSNRYLKAQLRPLTKPAFWASAGLFGVSLFALTTLLKQPDTVLSNGDRDAIVNLDENDSLTPEERARAAEIDDLSVLLKDLDKSQTIDSVSNRLNEAQTTNLEAPEAIADLNSNKPARPAAASNSEFTPLPPIDLTPRNSNNSSQNSTGSGFIGFDPRSSGQVGVNSTSSSNNELAPLAAALERYSANNSTQNSAELQLDDSRAGTGATSAEATSSGSGSTTPTAIGQRTGVLSNGVQSNGSPTYTPPLSASTSALPSSSTSQPLIPQNSNDNAYSQILNPNLVIPTAPTLPQPASPSFPALPPAARPSLSGAAPSGSNSSAFPQATAPTGGSSPNPVFGAPSSSTAAPAAINPAPYSVPNPTPGQYSGNGRINTFANP